MKNGCPKIFVPGAKTLLLLSAVTDDYKAKGNKENTAVNKILLFFSSKFHFLFFVFLQNDLICIFGFGYHTTAAAQDCSYRSGSNSKFVEKQLKIF